MGSFFDGDRRAGNRIAQLCAAALLSGASLGCGGSHREPVTRPVAVASSSSTQWENEIREFERADVAAPPRQGGVLFVGSSSIRMWPNIQADFPDMNVVQRGFGGSEIADAVYYAPRIVLKYRPRLTVFYAGDNDIANGKSPETVLSDYKSFVRIVEDALPDTRIAFISIKPSASRWALVDKIRTANRVVREYIAHDPRQVYVDVFSPMLGPDGLPRNELFLEDKLHMTPAGYALWRNLLTPIVRAP